MNLFSLVFLIIIAVTKYTWWFITPLVLFPLVRDLWLSWRGLIYSQGKSHTLLEIKIPQEILKTPKAMEVALAGIHGAWDAIDTKDKWLDGKSQVSFSLEIVGIDGLLHFFIRCESKLRNFVESKLYGQYPDIEILEAEDYTQNVPKDIPNASWDVWGTDMILLRDSSYPIRTYEFFEDIEEERRIDPLASLAEVISKTKEGEQVWIQIIISPLLDFEWTGGSKRLLAKLLGRKEPPKKPSAAEEIGELFTKGTDVLLGRELVWRGGERTVDESNFTRLSRGEQGIIEAVENKMSKPAYRAKLRTLYVARRDVMDKTIIASLQGIFRQFADQNLNGLRIDPTTKPSSSFRYLSKERNYMRKTHLLMAYAFRDLGALAKPYILNIEELATLYHFPGQIVHAPSTTTARLRARRGDPPSTLPME